MQKLITIITLLISLSLRAQTTIYAIKNESSKKSNDYYYFDHASGKAYKCFLCKEKERIPKVLIKIEGNKIYSFIEETEKKIQIGDFTSNKKIVKVKNGVRSSEENSPYIKDKKIYSSSGELLGIIDGKEIYGAAAYLMGQFR